MIDQTDVQLMAQSVELTIPAMNLTEEDTPFSWVRLTHPQFDDLAEKVTEAALNKKGRTHVTLPAEQVQAGDHLCNTTVTEVINAAGVNLTRIKLDPFTELTIPSGSILKIERPIQ